MRTASDVIDELQQVDAERDSIEDHDPFADDRDDDSIAKDDAIEERLRHRRSLLMIEMEGCLDVASFTDGTGIIHRGQVFARCYCQLGPGDLVKLKVAPSTEVRSPFQPIPFDDLIPPV